MQRLLADKCFKLGLYKCKSTGIAGQEKAQQKGNSENTHQQGHPEKVQQQGHPKMGQQQGNAENTQQQGHPEKVQQQGHPEMTQHQGHPEMVQQQGHPIKVQHHGNTENTKQQGHSEKVQRQGNAENTQQQGNPEQVQQQGNPDIVQQQGHPEMVQQQGHPEMVQQQGYPEKDQQQEHGEMVQHPMNVQCQGNAENTQQQGNPELVQQQGHPEKDQQQGNPEQVQQQGNPELVQQQGHSEKASTEMRDELWRLKVERTLRGRRCNSLRLLLEGTLMGYLDWQVNALRWQRRCLLVDNSKAQLQSQIHLMDKATSKLRLDLAEKELQFCQCREQLENQNAQMTSVNQQLDKAKENLQSSVERERVLQSQLDAAKVTLQNLRERSINMDKELISTKKAFNELEKLVLEKEAAILEHEAKHILMQKQYDEKLLEVKALQESHDASLQQTLSALEASNSEKEAAKTKSDRELETVKSRQSKHGQQLMEDCEWKLREIERDYKTKLDGEKQQHRQALQDAESTRQLVEERETSGKAELKQLRGLMDELQKGMRVAANQADELRVAELGLRQELCESRLGLRDSRLLISKLQDEICNLKAQHEAVLEEREQRSKMRAEADRVEVEEYWKDKYREEVTRVQAHLERQYEDDNQASLELLRDKKDDEIAAIQAEHRHKQAQLKLQIQDVEEHILISEKSKSSAEERVFQLEKELQCVKASVPSIACIKCLKSSGKNEDQLLSFQSNKFQLNEKHSGLGNEVVFSLPAPSNDFGDDGAVPQEAPLKNVDTSASSPALKGLRQRCCRCDALEIPQIGQVDDDTLYPVEHNRSWLADTLMTPLFLLLCTSAVAVFLACLLLSFLLPSLLLYIPL